ncbi:MAG: 50S ribosomal protein L32 [Chloroflexi bacterium]|nr:50S ribosomal protein L32 [Chloroflexota bacterium]
MGALPKRKLTSTRRGMRRAHWRLVVPSLVPCPRCRAIHMSHRVCPSCGTYSGREVIEIKTKKKEK